MRRLAWCLAVGFAFGLLAGAINAKAAQWVSNGNVIGPRGNAQLAIAAGTATLENPQFGTERCPVSLDAELWNESEKTTGRLVGLQTWSCSATFPCKVKEPNGEEGEGSFLTGEGPILFVKETERDRALRQSQLPWPLEIAPGPKLRLNDVGLTYVNPCSGFEDRFLRANAFELTWINGLGNGLTPSVFEGRNSLSSPFGEGALSISRSPLIGFPSAELITQR